MLLTKLKDSKYKNILINVRYKQNVFDTVYKHLKFKNITPKILYNNNIKSFNYYVKKLYKIVSYVISLSISKNNILFNN